MARDPLRLRIGRGLPSPPRPRVIGILLVALIGAGFLWVWRPVNEPPPGETAAVATATNFIGSAACAGCHAAEHAAWQTSQHARAMQHATDATVLGNFADARFTYAGVTSRFFRRDDRFFVRTDGPDGKLADFEVKYTFGVEPLQQYLIELPGGRLQALSISWDTRPSAEGGQRWFHLYPAERIDHRDELHWTKPAQNWNFMCADCHSTNLRKGFDVASETFNTTWSDIAVGCEACHGPGSQHAAAPTGSYRREVDGRDAAEINACAACHSRRAQFAEGALPGDPLMDHYLPSVLAEGLYHPDGRQQGEVFIWGSYMQSRKHAAGVTCGACHEPHTQKLRLPGNAVCTQCHAAAQFDVPQHHRQAAGSQAAECVSCHMPQTTYMVIDPRRDHSFHVPGVDPGFAAALVAGRAGTAGAVGQLRALAADRTQAPIVRASALDLLARYPGGLAAETLRQSLADPDPLVRHHALRGQSPESPQRLAQLLAPALADRVRANRHEAARQLAQGGAAVSAALDADARARLTVELADYERSLRHDLSRGEAWINLANLQLSRGDLAAAEAACRKAIRLDPALLPGWINLADLLRSGGREAEAESSLREALARNPGAPTLHEALGLSLVRQSRKDAALREFAAAHAAAPDIPRFRYVYALALHDAGRGAAARGLLAQGLARGFDRDMALALAAFAREAGDATTATQVIARLLAVNPGDPAIANMPQ